MAERVPDISRAVPRRAPLEWTEEHGRITIVKPRRGAVRRSVLRLFGVPPALRIHLDPLGSEVWRLIDGRRTVADIRAALALQAPGEADLNRRLGLFFGAMVSRGVVQLTAGSDATGGTAS